jgi:alpha-glucan phosphorylase-like protein
MEIGLSGKIPTFAGGLGVLAADLMLSATDMGLQAACVTMCWQHGYLRQKLRPDGQQDYESTPWEPDKVLKLLPERVQVTIEGRPVTVGVRLLELTSGKNMVPVYFLDTNVPENTPEDRAICAHLYGGDGYMRLRQEVVLGIGGVKMLRKLGYSDVHRFHMNEGHCAFLTLELLREKNFKNEDVRPLCAFTTHTPVPAGHDVFGYDMAWKICGDNLPWHIKEIAGEEALSMTKLAMNLSHYTCGVSQVHGQVSRRLLNNEAVDAITNGVHHTRWTCPEIATLLDTHAEGWRRDPSILSVRAHAIPEKELWEAHQVAKRRLLEHVNVGRADGDKFEENVLTIASARRVVPYKRPELLYTNLLRLKEIGCGRLQIIHAGNAHPHDQFSMDVIRRMVERSHELRDCLRIAYLPNYNPDLAQMLVSGADVWLNTPTRLHEASGTSGMKACLNGVINLSTLDGWWIEGYQRDSEAGWRIGPLAPALGPDDTRSIDAEDLYTQLQYEVIPEYYYPGHIRWAHRMRRAIGLMGYFNSQRCVEEYVKRAWK